MKILCLSDEIVPIIYSSGLKDQFGEIGLVIGCGDLPPYYLDYVVCQVNKPLYYVEGNHVTTSETERVRDASEIHGGHELHIRTRNHKGLLLAGIGGSLAYSRGPYQYSQTTMWLHVCRLLPRLLMNKMIFGRYLDIFVTHAPPWGIHDKEDLPHQGIKAFRWFDAFAKPSYHLHGHIHTYRPDEDRETQIGQTLVINTYRYKILEF